jgi:hypothetical protein
MLYHPLPGGGPQVEGRVATERLVEQVASNNGAFKPRSVSIDKDGEVETTMYVPWTVRPVRGSTRLHWSPGSKQQKLNFS